MNVGTTNTNSWISTRSGERMRSNTKTLVNQPYPPGRRTMVDDRGHTWFPDSPSEALEYAHYYGARFVDPEQDEL